MDIDGFWNVVGAARDESSGPYGDAFAEDVNYAASRVFERLTGDADAFHEAWKRHRAGHDLDTALELGMGEDFDFDDADEMHRRLPRLAALYLGAPAG